jgi:cytochrome c-type protein NapC
MLVPFLVIAILLAAPLVLRPGVGLTAHGRAFAFAALFALPIAAALAGVEQHVELSKRTEFCVSCHVMGLHGRSLRVDDDSLLAAAHFQHGQVPRETACFACHTTYTMYGDLRAKLSGLRHVWVNYVTGPPKETEIRTYRPYHNRECLHCHAGTRRFEEGKLHRLEAGRMKQIRKNQLSCLGKGCHELAHDVAHLEGLDEWRPPADLPADPASGKGGR